MRLLPQGAWFGLTRPRLRAVGWTLVTLSGLFAVAYGAARITQAIEYRRATVFLEELKNIQLGQSKASLMPFILRYNGSRPEAQLAPENDYFLLRVDSWHLFRPLPGPNWVDNAYRNTFLRLGSWRRGVKLRVWTVSGWVSFTHEKVNTVSGDLVIEGENEWLMADWHYGPEIPANAQNGYPNTGLPSEIARYDAHWTHLHFGDETGEGIMTQVTPLSTTEQLNAARNINLQCLMIGRGCHSLCELMPDATRYRREHNAGSWGWNSGAWGPQPHDCE